MTLERADTTDTIHYGKYYILKGKFCYDAHSTLRINPDAETAYWVRYQLDDDTAFSCHHVNSYTEALEAEKKSMIELEIDDDWIAEIDLAIAEAKKWEALMPENK